MFVSRFPWVLVFFINFISTSMCGAVLFISCHCITFMNVFKRFIQIFFKDFYYIHNVIEVSFGLCFNYAELLRGCYGVVAGLWWRPLVLVVLIVFLLSYLDIWVWQDYDSRCWNLILSLLGTFFYVLVSVALFSS